MTDSVIRVLVVDDHEVIRRGLAMFVNYQPGLVWAGEAASGEDAVAACQQFRPDVVLMDMVMPEMSGAEATRLIMQHFPHIRVLGLSTFVQPQQVREMLEAGAVGYLLKDTSSDDLASAIRACLKDQITLSPAAGRALVSAPPMPAPDFTQREREVLELMSRGMSNSEIAQQLVVSRSTIKFHVSNLLNKLNASSRVEAVSIAIQQGFVK